MFRETTEQPHELEGELLLGRYEVLRLLGTGGAGSVYACRDRLLCNWTVALKVMQRADFADSQAAELLSREITALSFLNHIHVARCYELISTPAVLGFTMELVDGGSITSAPEGALLSINEIVVRLLQLASGLQAIHRAGLVHRDLKPENVLVDLDGIVKIVDFGICAAQTHLVESSDDVPSGSGIYRYLAANDTISGSFDYMSPEQFRPGKVDCRSDIYSFGVIAYEMLTGRVPFSDLEIPALLLAKVQEDPRPLRMLRPECPPLLDALVLQAMRRDPEKRYGSAEELLIDLWALMRELELKPAKRRKVRAPWPWRRALKRLCVVAAVLAVLLSL